MQRCWTGTAYSASPYSIRSNTMMIDWIISHLKAGQIDSLFPGYYASDDEAKDAVQQFFAEQPTANVINGGDAGVIVVYTRRKPLDGWPVITEAVRRARI